SAHGAEVLHDELGGVVAAQQPLPPGPGELRGVDRGAGPERRAVPAPALGAVTVEDGTELAADLVGDGLAQAATGEELHERGIPASAGPHYRMPSSRSWSTMSLPALLNHCSTSRI